MAELRRFTTLDLALLLAVVAGAAGARAGYVMTCADGARNSGPLRVTDAPPPLRDFHDPDGTMRGSPRPTDQDALIHNVMEHQWFGSLAPLAAREEQTAHVSPGYPYLVGLLGTVVGADSLDSTVRWAQVGLGALTAGFYFLFARRAFRSLAVGVIAGALAALHPFWVVNVASIDDGTLASFALAACLLLASYAGEDGGLVPSLLLGLALAGVALVRAALLPFSFAVLVWFLLRTRGLPRGWLSALLAFLGFANGLAPWTVRNYQAFNEPVPVSSSAYLHLWVGNNPHATGGPATEAMWRSLEGEGKLGAELRQTPHQPSRYARLGREAISEVRDDPVPAVRRRMMAALYFLFGQQGVQSGTFAEEAPGGPAMPDWLRDAYPMATQAALAGLLVLALFGWRWSYGWRWESFPLVLAAVWVPLPYVLTHAAGLSGPRLPFDGVLLTFAAFAIGCLLPTTRGELLEAPGAGQPRRDEE